MFNARFWFGVVFFTLLTVGSSHAEPAGSGTACAIKEDGETVAIPFEFAECDVPEKFLIMSIPSGYLRECQMAHYKSFMGKIVNSSDRSTLKLAATLPELTVRNVNSSEEELVQIEIQTHRCNKEKEAYSYGVSYRQDWIDKLPLASDQAGNLLYGPPEDISPYIKKFKALTDNLYHRKDIYVVKAGQGPLVLRCKDNICVSDAESFLTGYVITYKYSQNFLNDAVEIDKKLKILLRSFFSS